MIHLPSLSFSCCFGGLDGALLDEALAGGPPDVAVVVFLAGGGDEAGYGQLLILWPFLQHLKQRVFFLIMDVKSVNVSDPTEG